MFRVLAIELSFSVICYRDESGGSFFLSRIFSSREGELTADLRMTAVLSMTECLSDPKLIANENLLASQIGRHDLSLKL